MSEIVLFAFIVIFSILCSIIIIYLHKKEIEMLNLIKNDLEENALIKFNHSYKLINKKDKSIRYLRVFYISLDKEVKCFSTNKNGEIGIWYDKIEFFYNIKDNYIIEDCGEWK